MRYFLRPAPPAFMQSAEFQSVVSGILSFLGESYRKSDDMMMQQTQQQILELSVTPNFPKEWEEKIKTELIQLFGDVCAFCEAKLDEDVILHRFRPASGAMGDGSFPSEEHYFWLQFTWENLYPCCPGCHRFKSNWFPVAPRKEGPARGPWFMGIPDLEQYESALLLQPCPPVLKEENDPGHLLKFSVDGSVKGINEQGKQTIAILNLNRKDLIAKRKQALEEWEDIAAKGKLDLFLKQCERYQDQPHRLPPFYSMLKQMRGYLELQKNKFLRERMDVIEEELEARRTKKAGDMGQAVDLGRLTIEKIVLHNFKGIQHLEIEIPPVEQLDVGASDTKGWSPWLLFLGENGVGKSSILQGIVLTLMPPKLRADKFSDARKFLRYTIDPQTGRKSHQDEGYVHLYTSEKGRLELSMTRDSAKWNSNATGPGTFLLAYGSVRLLPDKENGPNPAADMVRVANLFLPNARLADAKTWLRDLYGKGTDEDKKRFNLVARGLKRMLLLPPTATLQLDQVDGEGVHIRYESGETLSLSDMSDGYRSMIGLCADIMQQLQQRFPSMDSAEGIVIVDEIGVNLHPRWKMQVAGLFREVFPKVQFIVSTHDPLCLRGLYKGETVVVKRDQQGQIYTLSDNLPDPRSLRIEQLLTHDFFGLHSTSDEDRERQFNEYYTLLALREETLTTDQQKRLEQLKDLLKEKGMLGNTLREELTYEVVDKLLARRMTQQESRPLKELKEELVNEVAALWDAALSGKLD